MDNLFARLSLTAGATFRPSAPGVTKDQFIGFDGIQPNLGLNSFVHMIHIEVDNFGTGGNEITINADTLAVTFGGSSDGTPTKGSGIDYNGDTIESGYFTLVGMRITAAPSESVKIKLAGVSDEFVLLAANGTASFIGVKGTAGIAGAGNWTLKGPSGVQSSPWQIDILVVGEPA